MTDASQPPLRVFSDITLDDANRQLLVDGVAPHELVFPAQRASSVLDAPPPAPALAMVDIAVGQPDANAVLASPTLRWIHITSAGYTRYDTDAFRHGAKARGLLVTNSSQVYAEACAEHVFAFMLAQSRNLAEALRTHTANGTELWQRLRQSSRSLRGQNVLILGFGSIASRLVELLAPFETKITAFRRRARGDEPVPTITVSQLPGALAAADHVVNILPANADSNRFINAGRLAQMKRGASYYNIGRGTTDDPSALAHALRSGQLSAAWLDVTDPEPLPETHELLKLPNCHITPHTAGGHANEAKTLIQHFLANFRLFLAGEPLLDRII